MKMSMWLYLLSIFMMINATSQSSGSSDILLVQATWALAIGTMVGAGVVAYVTYRLGSRQHWLIAAQVDAQQKMLGILEMQRQAQERLNLMTAMLEVFKLLNDERHRNARREVFRQKVLNTSKEALPADYEDNAAMVRADFDQIGALVKSGVVPKELFMQSYADTTLRVWMALKDNLMEEREKRNQPAFEELFEWLYEEAQKWWDAQHPNEPVSLY